MKTVIKLSTTDKMQQPKEPMAESMGNGKARVYVGQRGKVKRKPGMMLQVLTAGLAPRGKNA